MRKKANTHNEGVRIVKVAAFCFALISWIATAQGLYQYVFQGRYWQALLISFGIQSILFVFNLKLPEYFARTAKHSVGDDPHNVDGETASDSENTKRYTGFAGKIVICMLYILVIAASSFFSFVYIANYVYADTRYNDANIILDRKYRTYLDNTYRYLNEYSKLARITISERLSELQELVPSSKETKTKTELEQAKNEAYRVFKDAEDHAKTAELKSLALEQIMNTPDNVRWRYPEEHEQEKAAYEQGIIEWETAKLEKNAAYLAYQNALSAIDAYKPTAAVSVREILEEALKPYPATSVIEEYMSVLIDQIMESDDEDSIRENFAEVVSQVQIVTVAVKNYLNVQEVMSSSPDKTDIEFLQYSLSHEAVVVPQPVGQGGGDAYSEFIIQKQEWENIWKSRFQMLERIIRSVPRLSEFDIEDYHGVVDVSVLIEFNPNSAVDDIDSVIRTNLEYINVVERAFALLNSDYPFLAWFSLGLAVFLDFSSMLAGLFTYFTVMTSNKKETAICN